MVLSVADNKHNDPLNYKTSINNYASSKCGETNCMQQPHQQQLPFIQQYLISHQRHQLHQPSSFTATTTTLYSTPALGSNYKCSLKLCHMLTLFATILLMWDNCILIVSGSPQSCILCDKNDLKAKDSSPTNYEEYLFEHQVTRSDAIGALKSLNESFYTGPPPHNSCKSVQCTKNVMKYCYGPQFINDHCWCEFAHSDEGLPYVPHICYMGEKIYQASVGTCYAYEELKDCCCGPALAKQWRHISAAHSIKFSSNLLIFTLLLIFNIKKCLNIKELKFKVT